MGQTPIAVTIAGSDSGGGAGIQADLKTFSALGVYGASVLTALTAQNTLGVTAIHDVPADFVGAQIDAVFSDLAVDAVKIGMLSTAPIVAAVAEGLGAHPHGPIVLDPVMIAKSGDSLLRPDARQALTERLLPLAAVVTPNLHEAGALTDMAVGTEKEMEEAATVDGCGPWRTWAKIILPLTKPALATLATLTFLASWNDFMWPLIVTNSIEMRTIPIGIAIFQGRYTTEYGNMMATALIASLPVMLVFLVGQKFVFRGFVLTGMKG